MKQEKRHAPVRRARATLALFRREFLAPSRRPRSLRTLLFSAGFLGAFLLTLAPEQLPPTRGAFHGRESAWNELVGEYEQSLARLREENRLLKRALLDAGQAVRTEDGKLVFPITLTGYSSTRDQTDDTPFVTASNRRVRPGILALSRDMLKPYNPEAPFTFGDVVKIPGLGRFRVEDSMNARWRRRGDIWFPSRRDALDFGVKETYLLGEPRNEG
jgi:3D (Asp-Asp-Asp) domain-containing protein